MLTMAVSTASKRNPRNGIEALKTPETTPATSLELSDLARQFLDLATEERAAVEKRDSIKGCEGKAVYDAAVVSAAKAREAAATLAKSIIEKPTCQQSDIIEKAIVAREYCARWPDGTIIDLTQPDLDLTAAARTVQSVLSLAGLGHDPIVPPGTRKSGFDHAQIAQRIAQRRGDDPDDHCRITASEDELIKIEALKDVVWILADGVDSLDTSTTSALQYVANRLQEHCEALRTTLFGDARELTRKGMARLPREFAP
jgi:hypothetical protein